MVKLKQKALKGFFWVTLSSFIVQSVQFLTKIILARLLMPQDFGIVAIALVIINAFALINDLGGSMAIVYFKSKKEEVVDTSFFITSLTGIVFFIFSMIFADSLAGFFGEPLLARIVRMFSIVFLLGAASTVSTSIITKELKFNKLFLAEIISTFVYVLLTVWMAVKGYGVWSLVAGYLASVTTSTLLLLFMCGWKPRIRFNLEIGKKLIHYGKYVIASNIFSFLALQGDNAVVGKVLNSAALGFYVLAYSLANLPATQIAGVISRVMFPTFSKLQNNYGRLREAYIKTIEVTLFIALPFIFGTTLVANEFVTYVLGDKWSPIIYPLYILLWFGLFRSIVKLTGYLFPAVGKPRLSTKIMAYEVIIFAILVVPLTLRFGIIGTSIATTIPMCLASFGSLFIAKRILDLRLLSIAKIFISLTAYSFAMSICVFLIKNYIFAVNSLSRLLLLITFGAMIYLGIVLLFDRKRIYELRDITLMVFK